MTRKTLLLCLVFSLYIIKLCSQPIYFNERYNFKDSNAYYNIEIATSIALHSGGYILGGSSLKYNQGRISHPFATLLIDTIGSPLKFNSFGANVFDHYAAQPGSILNLGDSSSFFLGNIIASPKVHSILFKLNKQGDTIWSKTYTDTVNYNGYLASSIIQAEDNNFVIALQARISNTSGVGRTRLLKIDSLGNVIWNKGFSGIRSNRPYSIDLAQDGGFIVGGRKRSTPSLGSDEDAWVFKTDSLGNMEWERRFGGQYDDQPAMCTSTKDGGAVCGYLKALHQTAFLYRGIIEGFKLDSLGNTVWHKEIGDSSTNGVPSFWRVKQMKDSSFVAVIDWLDSSGSSTGSLLKMNAQGDSLWHRIYKVAPLGSASQNYLRDFQPTEDGGFVAAGFVFPYPPDTGDQDMWVVKVDSFGCLVPGCQIVASVEELGAEAHLSVYPNPVGEVLNIYFKTENKPKRTDFRLLNMQGRLQKEWQSHSSDISYMLPVYDLENGMYVLQVLFDGKVVATEKVVVGR